jgi:opacity protein-like surface antigen
MSNTRLLAAAAATAMLAIPAAHAADLPPLPPPVYAPAPIQTSGWYLKGYVGMTNQEVKNANFSPNPFPNDTVTTSFLNFDSSPLFGMGVGYQFNEWLRFDFTGEYRSSAHFHGVVGDQTAGAPDDYQASKSEWLFLANAYVDLGTWWCVTPYVGAGIGGSRNTISGFTDIGVLNGAQWVGETHSQWNFAWALYAGVSYAVTPSFSVDLSYRYVDLGNAQTGAVTSVIPFPGPNNPFVFDHLTSQDVMLGVRWNFGSPPPPPPLMRKG